jgi:hypothetical protein
MAPKAGIGLAMLAFAALSFLSDRVPFVAIVLLLVAAVLFEWLLVRVRVADIATATKSSAVPYTLSA